MQRAIQQLNEAMAGAAAGPATAGLIDAVEVHAIDGAAVRDDTEIEFVAGGHHYRYPWLPEGRVAVERTLEGADRGATIGHELVERLCMKMLGWGYERAHAAANGAEAAIRRG